VGRVVIAIIDLAHCGTTMTAGVLERIGVPMLLQRGKRDKLEDMDAIDALRQGTFAQLVRQRASLPVWGFKWPGAWKFAPVLRECLPDATYVAIFKESVSVTYRRFGTIGGGKLEATCRWMAEQVAGINATGLPVHWLSYLEAVRSPCAFTARLARLVGVTVTGGQMDSVLEWIRGKAE